MRWAAENVGTHESKSTGMASANGATARAAASTENVALKRMVIICLGCTVLGVQVMFICSDGRVWIVKERLVVKEIKQGCKTQCQSVQAIEPQKDATTHSPVPARKVEPRKEKRAEDQERPGGSLYPPPGASPPQASTGRGSSRATARGRCEGQDQFAGGVEWWLCDGGRITVIWRILTGRICQSQARKHVRRTATLHTAARVRISPAEEYVSGDFAKTHYGTDLRSDGSIEESTEASNLLPWAEAHSTCITATDDELLLRCPRKAVICSQVYLHDLTSGCGASFYHSNQGRELSEQS